MAKKETKKTTIVNEDGEIMNLDEIKKQLLKKAKSAGSLDQSDIYDALSAYEIDDDTVNELITFFKEQGVEVISEDDDTEDEDFEEDFDYEKMTKAGADDDFEDFDGEENLEEDIDIEHLDVTLGGEVKVNDSVKMYLKAIGAYALIDADREIVLAKKILEGDEDAKNELINANLRLVVNGRRIRDIGTKARRDIEKLLNKHVFLELFVKVSEDWRNQEDALSKFGYKYEK